MKKLPWDFFWSLLIAVGIYLSLPYHNKGGFLKEIYLTATFILVIIIAVIYLSIILNTIGKKAEFNKALGFSLIISFSAFLYSAAFYFFTNFSTQVNPLYDQNKTWVVIGCLLTLHSFFTILKTGLEMLKDV